MKNRLKEVDLMVSGSANGYHPFIQAENCRGWTFVINSVFVTTGATVTIYGMIAEVWFPIHEEPITTNGSVTIRDEGGHYEKLRAGISNYTDGLYSAQGAGSWIH